MLNVKNLSLYKKSHKRHKLELLHQVTASFPEGRVSLLLGASGAGKSTLLRTIAQIEQDYNGDIIYQARPLQKMTAAECGQIIGYIAQSYPLFPHMSVLRNCTFAPERVLKKSARLAKEEALARLASFEIADLANTYPDEISGGQRQRVAIVRALLMNPKFLLFDEPTSALDSYNKTLFIDIVGALCREGKGIIIATHDTHLANQTLDRAILLAKGQVILDYDQARSPQRPSQLEPFINPHSKIDPK